MTHDKTNEKQMHLSPINLDSYMKLDKAVINALLLFPKNLEKKNSMIAAASSLYDHLNKCKSEIGSRCLKRWMKHPLQKKEDILERLEYVSYFVENPNVRTMIHNEIKKLPDLDALYFTFYKAASNKKVKAEISDLVKLYNTITSLNDLV